MKPSLPERRLSKSKFSMYLRTKCDRELYLSLFRNNAEALKAAKLPIPLKARPGVELITSSGRDFEYEQYDKLIAALPSFVIHESNGRAPIDPADALDASSAPSFILQPRLEPQSFREFALGNLGLSDAEQKTIPELSGLIPDVLYVHAPEEMECEILPDGSRKRVEGGDKRLGISVIDLKNVTEANASYAAEVCMYAFFLANWLASEGKALVDCYFVSDRVYLWKHVEMPNFTTILGKKEGGDHKKRLAALLSDLEDGRVDYLIYMPSVRKFFQEDVPRVVQQGDAAGWETVPYHVNPRCSACDFLGNPDWLSGDDQKHYSDNPNHYCFHNAEVSDHLSKMATLSKGASEILSSSGRPKVKDLVDIAPSAGVLKKHALLRKDRTQIGARAGAISTGEISIDNSVRIAGLARKINAEYDIVVNFDAGSGFLTGIAVRGMLFAPYGQTFPASEPALAKGFKVLGEQAFVVPKDNMVAEWSALQSFIAQLAGWIVGAEKAFGDGGWGPVRTQICFWEPRQYEELCNAFGRHLLDVLSLPVKHQRALAWLFPAEELMERDDHMAPGIVFIRDVVSNVVHLPVRFATTLLGTAEHYHHSKMNPRSVDKYYREPLSNAIPRERIFGIWKSPTGTVKIFGKPVSIAEAIQRYGDVLKAHVWALASITRRVREDLKDCIEGKGPALKLTMLEGMKGVAFDSKLWGQWEKVSTAAAETQGRLALVTRAEWLEASYKAIVLTKLVEDLGGYRYEFETSEESTEAKLEEGYRYAVVGIVGWPGFPLETGQTLALSVDAGQEQKLWAPLHTVLAATIERFDRANHRAVISFHSRGPFYEPVFDALMDAGILPIGKEPIYLLEGLPYNDSRATLRILREIKNPSCAKPAKEALQAMGKTAASKLPKGTDPVTPVARVLWEPDVLGEAEVRSEEQAGAIVAFAKTANSNALNESQEDAARAAARNQLSVIWGPPGTGKTDTLVALLHALVRLDQSKKILIAGPNYRTVEELSGRLLANLNGDPDASASFFWVCSRSREPKSLPKTNPHLDARSFRLEPGSADVDHLIKSMGDPNRRTIVATTAHIVHRITEALCGEDGPSVQPLFDLVVLDESSQIQVTLALRPLSVLTPSGQVVVAGDHLQMPPIYSLAPPKGAEYLVGSIQTYLLTRFKVAKQDLLVNYRSNRDLVEYAKTLGYPAKLAPSHEIKRLQPIADLYGVIDGMPETLPKTSAYKELLVPERAVTALIHDDPVSSQANEVEAKLVAGLAFCIRMSMAQELYVGEDAEFSGFTDEVFFCEGLGIVTPHKAQKALVLKELRALFPDADPEWIFEAVDTVERFQGGERQTIIVSFGVGDTDVIEGEEAFLLQMERTNVAVSRAKAKCIVLMPKSLAYHLPTDQEAAEAAVAIKSYIEEFCAKRIPIEIELAGTKRSGEVRWH